MEEGARGFGGQVADIKVGPRCCPLVWTCVLCNSRLEVSESRKLSHTRSNRLVNFHPGQTKFAKQRRQKCEIIPTFLPLLFFRLKKELGLAFGVEKVSIKDPY